MRAFLLFALLLVPFFVLADDKKGPAFPEKESDVPGTFYTYVLPRPPQPPKPGEEMKEPPPPPIIDKNDGSLRNKGAFQCLISKHSLNPTVMIAVRGSDLTEPLKDLIQKVDNAVNKNREVALGGFLVVIADKITDIARDDDAREEQELKLETFPVKLNHIDLAIDGKKKLEKFGMDEQTEILVLLYDRYRMKNYFKLTRPELTKEMKDKILKAIAEDLKADQG